MLIFFNASVAFFLHFSIIFRGGGKKNTGIFYNMTYFTYFCSQYTEMKEQNTSKMKVCKVLHIRIRYHNEIIYS